MSVDLGHLACCTSFDVFCDKGFHVWPPVVLCEQLECLGNPRMPSGHMIVEKGNYPPPKLVVCHNNQGGPVIPVGPIQ